MCPDDAEIDARGEGETLSRKERERERHRREILAAAERVFARKGYQAATVEEIAREAEFAVGTLYNLFAGKEDLYDKVIEGFAQEFMAQFTQKVLSVDDPEQAIAALIRLRLEYLDQHRGFIRIALQMAPDVWRDPKRTMRPKLQEIHAAYMEAVTEIFRRGVERGVFDQADPLYLALCLEGIINAFTAWWALHDVIEPLEVRVSKLCRQFIDRIKVRLEGIDPGAASSS